ncbi:hypothetical protein SZ64_07510 [Erythrobacter sp. SG61-1L]|nr:hypothetical protein SZ64_07510 [Erythrobacter sp. SG61-1L]
MRPPFVVRPGEAQRHADREEGPETPGESAREPKHRINRNLDRDRPDRPVERKAGANPVRSHEELGNEMLPVELAVDRRIAKPVQRNELQHRHHQQGQQMKRIEPGNAVHHETASSDAMPVIDMCEDEAGDQPEDLNREIAPFIGWPEHFACRKQVEITGHLAAVGT